MKKTQEILGLPIISISDAIEKGKVKGIVTNADKGAVDYIIVDSGVQVIGMRVISTENVLGIGEYALTIEDEKSIIDIESVPQAIELLQKDVQVKNTRVMTKKGRLIGETGDYYVNEDDICRIAGVEFLGQAGGSVSIIPRKNVITFGKNLIIVTEDAEKLLVDNIELIDAADSDLEKKNLTFSNDTVLAQPQYQPIEDTTVTDYIPEVEEVPQVESFFEEVIKEEETVEESEPAEAETPVETVEQDIAEEDTAEEDTVEEDTIEAPAYAEIPEVEEAPQEEKQETEEKPQPAVSTEGGAASLFEQRQRQYLKGRRATKTITDASGNVLVEDGTVITDDIIDAVKGSGKMIELVMNNKA